VVRKAQNRNIWKRVGNLIGLDPGDVGDHQVGRLGAVGADEMVLVESSFQLSSEEQVDPSQQDRRHERRVTLRPSPGRSANAVDFDPPTTHTREPLLDIVSPVGRRSAARPEGAEGRPIEEMLEAGLELIRCAEYFQAHEELELAWRAAEPPERDFF
jgi:Domain of unknown function (DUF309)